MGLKKKRWADLLNRLSEKEFRTSKLKNGFEEVTMCITLQFEKGLKLT